MPSMCRLIALSAFVSWMALTASAQEDAVIAVGGEVPPEVRRQLEEAQRNATASGGAPAAETPSQESKDKPADGGNSAESGEKKSAGVAENIKRPDKPTKEADPEELNVRPNSDGMISFQFQGQPWSALVDWYSKISGKSIDWRELPGDYVNIRTQRSYSLDETQDLLNRHLLARGFTFLRDGEYLTIEKTEGINNALVPRVAPSELAELMPYEFVKTSFRLRSIIAADAVKELESMKSKNGQMTAMAATNRIDVMDAATNLRQIYRVLEEEQESGQASLEEFIVEHVRAADIRTKLEELLGVEQKSKQPKSPEEMQQMMQMRQMRMQQQQQNGGQPVPDDDEPKIHFIVNERRNSVIVSAPPDKMFMISQAVKLLDIPSNRGDSLDAYLSRVRPYRLATLSPSEVVNILRETGNLDPSTTMHVDSESKAIIVSAPPWDHMIIKTLVEKLDGSAREFKVLRLRRRRADEVATTIESMMVGPKEDNSRSRRYYWWDDNSNDDKGKDEFRVGADIEHNWLLLWCNESEYEGVLDLLKQLGEITTEGSLSSQVRVLESVPGENQDDFLRRVRSAFEAVAPNPVVLPGPSPLEHPDETETPNTAPERRDPTNEARGGDESIEARSASASPMHARQQMDQVPNQRYRTHFTQLAANGGTLAGRDEEAEQNGRRQSPDPIRIERDSRGRLVLRSRDTAALDIFEELMEQMAPQQRDYSVFKLEYASATWVKYQLEDFFEDDEEQKGRPIFFWYDPYDQQDKKEKKSGLGDRRTMKFISEIDTNTIIVRNASAEQLAIVQDLIKLYDIPEPVNTQAARIVKRFRIKFSKARVIETTLKDVFRDLLSGNDKAFQQQQNEGDREGQSRTRDPGFSFFGGGEDPPTSGSPKASFKGKLSFGVDETTNMLIVTAEGEKLMEIVEEMINELDKAAVPSDDVRVVTLSGNANAANVKKALQNMFGPEKQPAESRQPMPDGAQGPEGEGGARGPDGRQPAGQVPPGS